MRTEELKQRIEDPAAPRRKFDKAFKIEIWERDGGRCQICGADMSAVCHIWHRGMGGNDRANFPENVIGLDLKCHNRLDHLKHPWLRIVEFKPVADESGPRVLRVEEQLDDGAWRELQPEELYFYQERACLRS